MSCPKSHSQSMEKHILVKIIWLQSLHKGCAILQRIVERNEENQKVWLIQNRGKCSREHLVLRKGCNKQDQI